MENMEKDQRDQAAGQPRAKSPNSPENAFAVEKAKDGYSASRDGQGRFRTCVNTTICTYIPEKWLAIAS